MFSSKKNTEKSLITKKGMSYNDDDDDYGGGYGSFERREEYTFNPKWGDDDDEEDNENEEMEEGMNKNDFEYQDNQTIIEECKEMCKGKDFIMESNAIPTVKRYLNAGGYPQEFVDLLADCYHGVAQLANLLADWLIVAGCSVEEVQELVEKHLKDLIMKNFDPKKADSIFSGAGQPPSWIEDMIVHPPWRVMFYELADKHPDCLMLNFTIKLISDSGYQTEVGTMSSACNQIEVFSKVLKTSVLNHLSAVGDDVPALTADFVKACCHGKHTYLYAQCMLGEIVNQLEQQSLSSAFLKWLKQELEKGALNSGHSIWYIVLILLGAGKYPRVLSSLMSLVEKEALNPGDVTVLYKAYSVQEAPPVAFLRIPRLLDLLVTSLFKPGSTVSPDHKPKYLFLLAYAVSVYEVWEDGVCESVFKEELKPTLKAIECVHVVCSHDVGSSTLQLTADCNILYQCIRYPVIAMAIMKWVEHCFSEKHYAKVITESVPLQIVLLDEISSGHPLQHRLVLDLLKSLFERNYPQLDTLVELEFKKTLIDRMIHMLSRGYILPVVSYVKDCMDRQITDVSLLRHFVAEVLEMIAPPYSSDFIAVMLPIVQNKEITAALRANNGEDDVTKFLAQCENG